MHNVLEDTLRWKSFGNQASFRHCYPPHQRKAEHKQRIYHRRFETVRHRVFTDCTDGQDRLFRPSSSLEKQKNQTDFIAETMLPTRYGLFRLRGYRHTVFI